MSDQPHPVMYTHGGGDWHVLYSDGSKRRDAEALEQWRERCRRELHEFARRFVGQRVVFGLLPRFATRRAGDDA